MGVIAKAAYRRLKKDFGEIGSNGHINCFVEEYVGPMVATADGWVKPQTTLAPANAEAKVTGVIAGGGFEPPTVAPPERVD